jgi:hypothetical protein
MNVITSENAKIFDNVLNCFVGIAACQVIVIYCWGLNINYCPGWGIISLNYHKMSYAIWCTVAGDVRNEIPFSVHKLSLKS